MTVLVLGDQLTREVGPVAARRDERVLLIEAYEFARRLPYHPHKLTLVFAAMRAFRDELEGVGREVEYLQAETFGEAFESYFAAHPGDSLVVMRPSSDGAARRLERLVDRAGGSLEVVSNELFLCSREAFERWSDGRSRPYRHEDFYRFMRRKTGYLLEDDEPVGGEWNLDDQNRETPGAEYDPPAPPRYEPDERTREVAAWVHEEFAGGYDHQPYGGDWADPETFRWPVTRADALDALDRFLEDRLADFGPYQDAMLEDEWAMNHALLAAPLNLGLLHPAEVVEAAIERYQADPDVPLNSIEGFLRQVIGWREFVRGVYREAMPDLAEANQLDATAALPDLYWTGETEMACVADAVGTVRERGYSHHIKRLMILSNFALLYGVEPRQLNRWFHAAYVDAFHWVTTPNVVEMGCYGSGVFATKPYAASANYVNRMSDYCSSCPYDHTETTGEDACPFNALYWDFLDRNEDHLRENHRMALVYSHLENKDREAIAERADQHRRRAEDGVL